MPVAGHQRHQHQADRLRHWRDVRRFRGRLFCHAAGLHQSESFTFIESATVLAIVVLGGLGSQLGVALAAVVMVGGLEMLRELLSWVAVLINSPTFAGVASELPTYRMLIFGVALVIMMVLRPRGLVSGRAATATLGAAASAAMPSGAMPSGAVASGVAGTETAARERP